MDLILANQYLRPDVMLDTPKIDCGGMATVRFENAGGGCSHIFIDTCHIWTPEWLRTLAGVIEQRAKDMEGVCND